MEKKGQNVKAPSIDQREIGAILKARREELNLSQRAIADALGYRNANFITMLEKGDSKVPIAKIPGVLEAYELDAVFGYAILASVYPEIWETDFTMQALMAERNLTSFDALMGAEKSFKKYKRSYKVKL